MSTVNREALAARLLKEEGLRLTAYVDTVGKITIGCGRNLSDKGITGTMALAMLQEDITDVINALNVRGRPWFSGLDQVRQQVCCDMAFNLGVAGFFGFPKMIRCLSNGDFAGAAREMLASTWEQQVGARAHVLAAMMDSGVE